MAYFRDFESNLSRSVAAGLVKAQGYAVMYANAKAFELLNELLNDCPSPKRLKEISALVNNIKGLIASADRKVDQYRRITSKLRPAISAGKTIVNILSSMPLPSTIGTPPGPAGGVIISVPTGVIQKQSNLLVWSRKMVQTLEDDVTAINNLVNSASTIFQPVKSTINQIEVVLAGCIQNQDLTLQQRKEILDSLGQTTVPTQQDFVSESYIGENGRTYELSVIEEINPQNPDLPRRQAVARDFRGIIILKGPLSFAGDTKVLIDELKYRIDNQLP